MIEFTDSFSQAAVAEACSAFPNLLNRLSLELTLPIFLRQTDDNGDISGPAEISPPKQLRKTQLFVSSRDMVDNLPKEIGFCRLVRDCDTYGTPHGEWRMILNGCYYNHGDNAHPQWSSHT
ncbi:hypothetical protein LZP69_08410 [Shewanella sp. AS1]|uniref:hypothetical protein n=1 Tax=Shewanella sp. AS1 TaxID=2907626 RepID=UPI001F386225|nr:hypothetical protein [Shewanella sp. AS1]MCE9679195.1 hypothetical protein [Shewanella sp. AS1]